MLNLILHAYGLKNPTITVIKSGLINETLRVNSDTQEYLIQQINAEVFPNPHYIDENINKLALYFSQAAPNYLFTAPIHDRDGKTMVSIHGHYFRAFNWVKDSHTKDVATNVLQAEEAGKAFGTFTYMLEGFDCCGLHDTLPDFHNLLLRYQQFENALHKGNPDRIRHCTETIQYLIDEKGIVRRYEGFIKNREVKKRVTHHDTKISNVLFDEADKSICIIDLDTVMAGYFLSDVGDMFRTYICPVSEEEKNYDLIHIRKEYLSAIEKGYLHNMGRVLSGFEKDHIYFGGEMLIYMQALRFITDYLNNDVYYGSAYPGQNKVRAENQSRLLALFKEAI